jgi:uncharacterized protein DUF2784
VTPASAEVLANVVLVVHACVAAFVVAGLLLIVLGNVLRWWWVNNVWFRTAHAAAIAIIVVEAWLGFACPLTVVERSLRTQAGVATYGGGFIEHWLGRLLYYQAPPWVFVLAYSVFALLVALTWWRFPPERRGAAAAGPTMTGAAALTGHPQERRLKATPSTKLKQQ